MSIFALIFSQPAEAAPCVTTTISFIGLNWPYVCQLGLVEYNFNGSVVELTTDSSNASVSFQAFDDRQIVSFINLNTPDTVAFNYQVTTPILSLDNIIGTYTVDPTGGTPDVNLLEVAPTLPWSPSTLPATIDQYWEPPPSGTLTSLIHTLNLSGGGTYWDGTNFIANGVVDGGTGVWNATDTNWTGSTGIVNGRWPQGLTATFAGLSGGIVTINGVQRINGLEFLAHDYVLRGDALQLAGGANLIRTNDGVIATIESVLTGSAGSSRVWKYGFGTLILSGDNSYTGGTLLDQGVLGVGSNTALGTGAVTMEAGTTLRAVADNLTLANAFLLNGAATVDSQAFALTLGGVMSGAGSLTKTGSGSLTLTGDNSYTGATTVNGGVLQIGDAGRLGQGAYVGAIGLSGGSLRYSSSADQTLSGVVSGSGSLTKDSAGSTLTLTGDNSYTGGTFLQQGAIGVGSNTALGSGAATMSGGTTLRAVAADLTLANAFLLNGAATVDTQAFALTLGGVVGGIGGLTKTGAGSLTLTGDNSYTGGTFLQQGAIGVGSNTALGLGAATMEGGTTLRAVAADLTLANAFLLNGAATVDTQAFALTLGGVVGGAGGLTKTGSGSLTLTGDNSYSGGTFLQQGAIGVGGNTALGSGAATMEGGTTLRAAAADLTLANAFLLNGAATVDTQTFALTLGGVMSGAGGLTKTGLGSLTLTGDNSYTGATTVNGGVLQIGGAGRLGQGAYAGSIDINAGATLRYSSSAAQTFSGPVNGGGTLVKDTGATSTLTLANAANLSAVDIQAGGLENRASLTAATAMSLSGDGTSLLNAAGATLTVNGGAGTLTGGPGAQRIDTYGAIAAPVDLGGGDDSYVLRASGTQTGNVNGGGGNDGLQIETAAAATRTLGPGAFVNFETIDLNKDPSSTGTVAIASGLALDAGPGGGALTLHRGALQLQDATSAVRAATVAIAQDAILSGVGQVATGTGPGQGLIVNGTISPGNGSTGALNVVGNYTQNGAYDVEFRAPAPGVAPVAGTDNDLINVVGAATVNDGALLRLFPLSAAADYTAALTAGNNPTPGKLRYTIIQTTGGINVGKISLLGFSGVSTEVVNGRDLQLVLTSGGGGNGGQSGLLVTKAPSQLGLVLLQEPQFGCRGSLLGRNAIGFHEARSDKGCLWADAYARTGGVRTVSGGGAEPWTVAGAKYTVGGFAFGGDWALNPRTFAGGSFTYGDTTAHFGDVVGSHSMQGFHGAAYGAWDDGVWNAGVNAGYSHYEVYATRSTQLPLSPTAKAEYSMRQYHIGGVLRRTLTLDDNLWLLPEGRLGWEPVTRNAFAETYGGDANFNSLSTQWNYARAGLGVILRHRLPFAPTWLAEAEAGWQTLIGNTSMPLRGFYQGASTTLYQTPANAYARDSLSVRGALTNRVTDKLSFVLNYAGQFNAQRYDNLFNVMLRQQF